MAPMHRLRHFCLEYRFHFLCPPILYEIYLIQFLFLFDKNYIKGIFQYISFNLFPSKLLVDNELCATNKWTKKMLA